MRDREYIVYRGDRHNVVGVAETYRDAKAIVADTTDIAAKRGLGICMVVYYDTPIYAPHFGLDDPTVLDDPDALALGL